MSQKSAIWRFFGQGLDFFGENRLATRLVVKVNEVEWLVSTPAARVLVIQLSPFASDSPNRDYTFVRSAFYGLSQTFSGVGCRFSAVALKFHESWPGV